MYLHVACNDPCCGHFEERASMISIGSIELQAKAWVPPRFVDLGDRVRLAGKCWPVIADAEWVGNWAWNAYALGNKSAKTERWWLTDFAIWLRGRGLYSIDVGPEGFFDWWNREREAPPAEVHGWICDAIDERYTP